MPEKPEPGSFPDTAILDEDGFAAPRGYCIPTNHASPSSVLPLDDVPLTRPSPACSVPRVTTEAPRPPQPDKATTREAVGAQRAANPARPCTALHPEQRRRT